jgi:hypothetical protein
MVLYTVCFDLEDAACRGESHRNGFLRCGTARQVDVRVSCVASSKRRWRPRPRWGEERRGVDRRTATLMYAGRNRKSSMRRTVPLTKGASGEPGWHRKHGGLPCSGGAPTLLDQLDRLRSGSDRVMRPSRPTGTLRARGRSRWPRWSWTPCGRRAGESAHTGGAGPPRPASRSPGEVPAGAGASGR